MNTTSSVVIPFVGTLNDNDIASPVFYQDRTGAGTGQERLVDTPSIQMRKDRMLHYLRYLPVRFLDNERLFLHVAFVTNDTRPIDATNVLDLIQNAGNRLIWNDDSQFVNVHSRRCVISWLRSSCEMTIVYVGTVAEPSIGKMSLGTGRFQRVAKDFRERYDIERCLRQHFGEDEQVAFRLKGFRRDNRFLKIPALRPAYVNWLIRCHPEDSGDGLAPTNIQQS